MYYLDSLSIAVLWLKSLQDMVIWTVGMPRKVDTKSLLGRFSLLDFYF
jgi:hypothetical protein